MENKRTNGGYQDPEAARKARIRHSLVIGCVILLLLLAVLVASMVFMLKVATGGRGGLFDLGGLRVPPAEVVIGGPWDWRDITPQPEGYLDSPDFQQTLWFSCGDFDGDGADEVALRGTHLVEIDGSTSRLNPPRPNGTDWAWDGDGDGIADVLENVHDCMEHRRIDCRVHGSADGQVHTVKGNAFVRWVTSADFENDGRADLLTTELICPYHKSCYVYSPGFELIWQLDFPEGCDFPTFGDTDGDGLLEIVAQAYDNRSRVTVFHQDGTESVIPGWDPGLLPVACLDVNGDGRAEVFANNQRYWDFAASSYTTLEYPKEVTGGRSRLSREGICLTDLDRDGERELTTRYGRPACETSGVFCFNVAGECIRYEEMGTDVRQWYVLHDAEGRDYLLLQTDRRLLIYP